MPVAILFSGQGAQKVGMGKSLFDNDATARELYERANEALGYDFAKVCFEGPAEDLTKTDICQPALYVHGYAVYQILKHRGKLDDVQAAMGLSLGELTALAAADVYDFETGLKIVAERGRLMQVACDQTNGTMASVIGGEQEAVEALCQEFDIDMANLNCPGQIVISGEREKVEAAVAAGPDKGFRRIIPLTVAGAYHSRLMEPARAAFESYLSGIEFKAPKLKVFSNVDAEASNDPEAIKAKLVKQVVSSVRWEECMRAAAAAGIDSYVECGVGAVLKGLARRTERSWIVSSHEEYSEIPE